MRYSCFLFSMVCLVFVISSSSSCGKTADRCVTCTNILTNTVTKKTDTIVFKTCKIDDLNYSQSGNGVDMGNSQIVRSEYKSVDEMLDLKLKSNNCK